MSESIRSLIASGTKLYLDSIDPVLVQPNIEWGAVGATSNPIIISDLLKTGRYDDQIRQLVGQGKSDDDICWTITDRIVQSAQAAFLPCWRQSAGNAGWVSFELDPLIDDQATGLSHSDRVDRYIALGRQWSSGHENRMIKIPATPAGIEATQTLAASGVTLNVTLVFTQRQYLAARDRVWAGALERRDGLDRFKSVYSIFVSRIDQYTATKHPQLSPQAQGQYGILNAKRIFEINRQFWLKNPTRLQQEIIFASTGTKSASDLPWKYVAALAGADIQTNPPATNDAIAKQADLRFDAQLSQLPTSPVQSELDQAIDLADLESVLMSEGLEKFASPQKRLLDMIQSIRNKLAGD